MEISCAFPTALDSPEHVALAEELGYDRAWLYDTPQQSTDVWVTLALAARARAGARRRGVRDGVHRPPGDGLPPDPVGVHGRLHPCLPRPAARRDDRVGGRAHADGEIVEEVAMPDGLGVFACGLGGEDGRTLIACAAPDFHEGPRKAAREAVLLTTTVDVPRAGLP